MPPKILFVEDDYVSMHYLKDAIEEEFPEFSVELTAEAALVERLKTEKFDLILADIMIHNKSQGPDGEMVENMQFEDVNWRITGAEFIRRLRSGDFEARGKNRSGTLATVPVIALSAVADMGIKRDLEKNWGIAHYAEKPFDLDDLFEKIQELLAKSTDDEAPANAEKSTDDAPADNTTTADNAAAGEESA